MFATKQPTSHSIAAVLDTIPGKKLPKSFCGRESGAHLSMEAPPHFPKPSGCEVHDSPHYPLNWRFISALLDCRAYKVVIAHCLWPWCLEHMQRVGHGKGGKGGQKHFIHSDIDWGWMFLWNIHRKPRQNMNGWVEILSYLKISDWWDWFEAIKFIKRWPVDV